MRNGFWRSDGVVDMTMIADDALGEAIGRGPGWSPGTFLAAHLENRKQETLSTLEDPILANMVLKQVKDFFGLLEGCAPASEFHSKLTLGLEWRVANSRSWPKTLRLFANELRRRSRKTAYL